MTVRLRPHHLLCMLTYVGKGYSPAFTENYDAIAVRLAAGETIVVVDGPDDICAPLLSEGAPHCHDASVLDVDSLAARDVGTLLETEICAGLTLRLDRAMLDTLRSNFAQGVTRAACAGCEWSALCDSVAATGFTGARIDCGF